MRVLYCTDTYPPQINGVSIVTELSVTGLTRRGWDCAVVAPRYPAGVHTGWRVDPDASVGPPVTSLPSVAMPRYPDVRLAVSGRKTVRQVMAQFRPDLVHCETEFSIGYMGQRAAACISFVKRFGYVARVAREKSLRLPNSLKPSRAPRMRRPCLSRRSHQSRVADADWRSEIQ